MLDNFPGWMNSGPVTADSGVSCDAMRLKSDDLTDARVVSLLAEHLATMRRISPPESVHALDLPALRATGITFWTAWDGEELLGCGALKELDAFSGEIKSMHTAQVHRGRGVGSKILRQIIDEAGRRGYRRLLLETGSQPEFAPAHAMYQGFGFRFCGPFADYVDDPNSVFMTASVGPASPA